MKNKIKKRLTRDDDDVCFDTLLSLVVSLLLLLLLQHEPLFLEAKDLVREHAEDPGLLEGEPAVAALAAELSLIFFFF